MNHILCFVVRLESLHTSWHFSIAGYLDFDISGIILVCLDGIFLHVCQDSLVCQDTSQGLSGKGCVLGRRVDRHWFGMANILYIHSHKLTSTCVNLYRFTSIFIKLNQVIYAVISFFPETRHPVDMHGYAQLWWEMPAGATDEAALCAEIEQSILRPYPKQPVKFGSMIHWGHLLHYLVGVAKMIWGNLWPTHVVISESTSAQGMLKQQQGAKIICTVIYNDSHWALLVYRVASRLAVLVDGKTDKVILEKSQAFLSEVLQKQFPLADCLVSSLVSRPGLQGHLFAYVFKCRQVNEHPRNI